MRFSKYENSRATILRSLAVKMDMDFEQEDEYGLLELLRDFKLFRKGRKKKIYNVMRSVDEWMETDIKVFDYHYLVGKNRQRNYKRQTVFFVKSKALGLPELMLKPENLFHKVAEHLGMQDIDFDEYPKFSQQYLLQGDDEELIRDAMTPSILRFFTVERNWTLEGINYFMIFYRKNRLLDPRAVLSFYKKGRRLHDMFAQSSF